VHNNLAIRFKDAGPANIPENSSSLSVDASDEFADLAARLTEELSKDSDALIHANQVQALAYHLENAAGHVFNATDNQGAQMVCLQMFEAFFVPLED
jgi:hypothetical protein